jgi:hypothetical protein
LRDATQAKVSNTPGIPLANTTIFSMDKMDVLSVSVPRYTVAMIDKALL